MTTILVLGVTGSRYATSAEHRQRIGATLLRVSGKYPPGDTRWQLYHGDAPGADTVTADLCFGRGYCWSDGIHARPLRSLLQSALQSDVIQRFRRSDV